MSYSHPKILTIGLQEAANQAVRDSGYRVTELSLGLSYKVVRASGFSPIPERESFPNDYKEHDLVIIDLNCEILPAPPKSKLPSKQLDVWWGPNRDGLVHPQMLSGYFVRPAFSRILREGGIFIIFADQFFQQKFTYGHLNYMDQVDEVNQFQGDNWNFLNLQENGYLEFQYDHGNSVKFSDEIDREGSLARSLKPHLENVEFRCTFSEGYAKKDAWLPVLVNKYGAAVGGILEVESGFVLILPDFKEKAEILKSLLNDVLPALRPSLFPDQQNSSWTTEDEYELPRIIGLKQEVRNIERQAEAEMARINTEIMAQRLESEVLFDLARETGEKLVTAVRHALNVLGFEKVIDADAELLQQGKIGQNREDLQIHDGPTTLIVEVKGINGFPSDDDALAVQKYIVLRMKEWKRVNVQGLTIMNHQRNLPPLSRDNEKPFRDDLVHAAEEQQIGLMTGWDLHRLVRSFVQNGWTHEQVRPIFYRHGRVNILPAHYEHVGIVEKHIEKASIIGIKLSGQLRKNDRLGFELPTFFKEESCSSMQVNSVPVEVAEVGSLVGVQTTLLKGEIRIGMPVYRVRKQVTDG